MTKKPTTRKEPRERAARALCRLYGNPENIPFEGKPMWESYLQDVDTVLEAIGWKEPPHADGER